MPPRGINVHMSASNINDKTEYYPAADAACDTNRKWTIKWFNAIFLLVVHSGAIYAIYLIMTNKVMWKTTLFCYLSTVILEITGITAGAHRLWAHRTYKARWPLRLCLVLSNSVTLQGPILNWVRDHRMHHLFTETDADPHNSSRGFFFSHIGWLLLKKHPDIVAKGHSVDMTDVNADPLVRFQRKYYIHLAIILNLLLVYMPTLWSESFWNAIFTCFMLRIVFSFHCTFLVNSAAHMWGSKPYDKNIAPADNKIVSWFIMGEGFHNYHHTFPWDYKTAELGNYSLNLTMFFIDVMAKVGLAYDLKTVSPEVIKNRIKRTGEREVM